MSGMLSTSVAAASVNRGPSQQGGIGWAGARGAGKVEPGYGSAGIEVAAAAEARRYEATPHARRFVRREVNGDDAAGPVQQRQQPGDGGEAQHLAALACAWDGR